MPDKKNPLMVPYPQKRIPGRKKSHKEIVRMKINFGTVMLDVHKKPIKGEKVDEVETDLTLKEVAISSLLGGVPNENPTGEEKYKRYKLFKKIDESESMIVELTAEDVAKLKELIGRFYLPLVVGRATDALETPVVD